MMAPVEDMQIFSYGSCPEGNSTQVIAIGNNAEDPQRMADFIDWLYSPEGIELNGQANGAAGNQRADMGCERRWKTGIDRVRKRSPSDERRSGR